MSVIRILVRSSLVCLLAAACRSGGVAANQPSSNDGGLAVDAGTDTTSCKEESTCAEEVTCAFGCIDQTASPPMFSVSCIATCAAAGCPASQFFFDQVANCLTANIGSCGPSVSCLMGKCESEIAACNAGG